MRSVGSRARVFHFVSTQATGCTHRVARPSGVPTLQSDTECWQFGAFKIDRRRRLLSAHGKTVKLDAKAFDLLEYLVSRRHEAPTRDEIVASVWRGATVSEGNLSVQLSALRRALHDHGGEKLILTLPGRRYRFVGDLLPTDQAPAIPLSSPDDPLPAPDRPEPAARRPRLAKPGMAAAGALLALLAAWHEWPASEPAPAAATLSMLVLPFHNIGERSQDYLAEGVTDDLTTALARLPGSLVISRETAQAYAERRQTTRQTGQTLNVRYVLEGAVFTDEAKLRINARLTDTRNGALLWTKPFTVPRDRISDARDLIAGQIVATLGPVLVQAESVRSRQERPDDPSAVDLLFRARYALDLGDTLADYQTAQDLLVAALKKQPDFTEAIAELGWLLVCKVANVDDPDQEADEARARQAINHALQLAPHNERALAAQGRLLAIEGDYAAAIASAREALKVQPNEVDAEWVLGTAEYYLGHLDAAAAPIEASLRIDPEGPHSKQRYQRLGSIQLFAGHYADAIANLQMASAGDVTPAPGDGSWGRLERVRLMLIAAHALRGDLDAARALYASYDSIWAHRSVWRIAALVPKTLAALPGFQKFRAALLQAGMDPFADETADDHVEPSRTPLTGGDFAPTPRLVPGANTILTAALQTLLRGGGPVLVIDLGTGTAVIDHAVWGDSIARNAGDDAFVGRQASLFLDRFPHAPVVIMADGAYGVTSYNATLHLTARLGRQVYWYRGGEEAWAKAGLPGYYRRSD